jgi:Membrane domain of glycerophosphoryl diester phosphodiesterase
MTDSPSSDTPGDGPPAQPQPWFPPADLGAGSPPPPPPGSAPPPPGYPQPGYGQPGHGQRGYSHPGPRQPGYRPPPPGPGPRYGDSAPKPGVIPLRPLGLGEILDGSFATIRRNPRATLGIAAIIMTISVIISVAVTRNLVNVSSPGQNLTSQQAGHLLSQIFADALPVLGVTVLLTIIVQAVLAGLLAPVIAREASGQRISAGDAWRAAAPRLPSVLLATLLVLLAGLGPLLVLGLILLIGFAASASPVIIVAIGVPGFLVAVVLSIWFSTMFSLVTPVVVLEHERPGAALARSWRLVRRSFWRVFGILLLAGIIVAVAGSILQLPFLFLSTLFGGSAGFTAGTVIAAIGTIAAGTVTRPISAAVTVLLYVDMRMRKEGLDLALRTAAGGGPLADSDFAAAWQPPRPGQPAAAPPAPPPGAPPTAAGAPPPW